MTSKFALVIANTEYQDASFAKLTAPGKDAEEFAQVLREPELAAFDDVQILLNEGESKTRRSIARFFTDRKRDDLLLLYFSGHGVRNEQGQLFLAANDTEINILEASGIPADFVTYSMNNSRSQRQLLILDCCNSGAFAHGSKSASGVGKSMGIATAFEGSGFGRVVLTATDATQYAWEGDKVIGDTQKSVFTHFLIEGLKGEADINSDGRIDVDELYDYAYEQVVRRTPKQTPGKWSYKQQGDIVLRENLQPREVKPAPLPSDLLELLSHSNSSVRRVGIQDLISLLDGKHLGLARAAQDKLREIAAEDDSLTIRKTAGETLLGHGFSLEVPAPVEIPGDKQREGFKIEKPVVKPARSPEPLKPSVEKKAKPNLNYRILGGIAGGVILIALCIWGSATLLNNFPLFAPEATRTSQPTQPIASSSETSLPSTPVLGIGSTIIGVDGMTLLYVPGGEFTMGSDADDALAECQKFRSDCQRSWFTDEEPPHPVDVNAFWIDQTEVTVRMYYLCVEEGVCKEPTSKESYTHSSYYGNGDYDNYPVIYVDWNMAKTYCEWVDRRLPTEAEWEKAARGTDANIYPWGNEFDGLRVNFCDKNCAFDWADKSSDDGFADTSPVGNYSNGASPYGALDMVGNVWESVSSLYQPYPYSAEDGRENLNSSDARVLRGGSWLDDDGNVRSAVRLRFGPTLSNDNIGFRCSRSADEQAESSTSQPSITEAITTATPELGIGSTILGTDGMTLLYVPAGEFTMGSDTGDPDEQPIQKINLDAFWIDQTEVTNKMYSLCVSEGRCKEPDQKGSATRLSYYGNPEFDNFPVLIVDWTMAKTYCEWADRRLPTEDEWEKAARGENAFVYPWGNDAPNNNLLNYNSNDTTEVGKYPEGVSFYGALDMAGNVWEWVSSLYMAYPYDEGDGREDMGSSALRVIRGGSWVNRYDHLDHLRSAGRGWFDPGDYYYVGFRCAMSATP
jgi:formylglycine-generating enzyme required for sulfatase activity/uncharacterized caspase-like protein